MLSIGRTIGRAAAAATSSKEFLVTSQFRKPIRNWRLFWQDGTNSESGNEWRKKFDKIMFGEQRNATSGFPSHETSVSKTPTTTAATSLGNPSQSTAARVSERASATPQRPSASCTATSSPTAPRFPFVTTPKPSTVSTPRAPSVSTLIAQKGSSKLARLHATGGGGRCGEDGIISVGGGGGGKGGRGIGEGGMSKAGFESERSSKGGNPRSKNGFGSVAAESDVLAQRSAAKRFQSQCQPSDTQKLASFDEPHQIKINTKINTTNNNVVARHNNNNNNSISNDNNKNKCIKINNNNRKNDNVVVGLMPTRKNKAHQQGNEFQYGCGVESRPRVDVTPTMQQLQKGSKRPQPPQMQQQQQQQHQLSVNHSRLLRNSVSFNPQVERRKHPPANDAIVTEMAGDGKVAVASRATTRGGGGAERGGGVKIPESKAVSFGLDRGGKEVGENPLIRPVVSHPRDFSSTSERVSRIVGDALRGRRSGTQFLSLEHRRPKMATEEEAEIDAQSAVGGSAEALEAPSAIEQILRRAEIDEAVEENVFRREMGSGMSETVRLLATGKSESASVEGIDESLESGTRRPDPSMLSSISSISTLETSIPSSANLSFSSEGDSSGVQNPSVAEKTEKPSVSAEAEFMAVEDVTPPIDYDAEDPWNFRSMSKAATLAAMDVATVGEKAALKAQEMVEAGAVVERLETVAVEALESEMEATPVMETVAVEDMTPPIDDVEAEDSWHSQSMSKAVTLAAMDVATVGEKAALKVQKMMEVGAVVERLETVTVEALESEAEAMPGMETVEVEPFEPKVVAATVLETLAVEAEMAMRVKTGMLEVLDSEAEAEAAPAVGSVVEEPFEPEAKATAAVAADSEATGQERITLANVESERMVKEEQRLEGGKVSAIDGDSEKTQRRKSENVGLEPKWENHGEDAPSEQERWFSKRKKETQQRRQLTPEELTEQLTDKIVIRMPTISASRSIPPLGYDFSTGRDAISRHLAKGAVCPTMERIVAERMQRAALTAEPGGRIRDGVVKGGEVLEEKWFAEARKVAEDCDSDEVADRNLKVKDASEPSRFSAVRPLRTPGSMEETSNAWKMEESKNSWEVNESTNVWRIFVHQLLTSTPSPTGEIARRNQSDGGEPKRETEMMEFNCDGQKDLRGANWNYADGNRDNGNHWPRMLKNLINVGSWNANNLDANAEFYVDGDLAASVSLNANANLNAMRNGADADLEEGNLWLLMVKNIFGKGRKPGGRKRDEL